MTYPDSIPGSVASRFQSGLLSFGLHVVLIVAAALFITFQPPPAPPGGNETPRVGEIVLAQSNPDADTLLYETKSDSAQATPLEATQPPKLPESAPVAEPVPEVAPKDGAGPIIELSEGANQMDKSLNRSGLQRALSQADLDALAKEQKALAGRQQPGPLVTTSLFGSGPIQGRRFVFLIDRSASMGERGLGVLHFAEKELVLAVRSLTPENYFQVLAYNERATVIGERTMLAGTDDNKQKISEFIFGLAAFGSTEHEAGLYSALAMRPDVIVWMTDGGYPEMNPGQIQAFCASAGKRVAVHAFEFGTRQDEPGNSFMRDLAKASGGSYRYVDINAWKEQHKDQ